MNAAEYRDYIAERQAATPRSSLRSSLYYREGVEATDEAIRRGLRAWAVEREGYGLRETAIVFGRNASDAKRRAAAPTRLAEEYGSQTTRVAEITSGWDDESFVWPHLGGQ